MNDLPHGCFESVTTCEAGEVLGRCRGDQQARQRRGMGRQAREGKQEGPPVHSWRAMQPPSDQHRAVIRPPGMLANDQGKRSGAAAGAAAQPTAPAARRRPPLPAARPCALLAVAARGTLPGDEALECLPKERVRVSDSAGAARLGFRGWETAALARRVQAGAAPLLGSTAACCLPLGCSRRARHSMLGQLHGACQTSWGPCAQERNWVLLAYKSWWYHTE